MKKIIILLNILSFSLLASASSYTEKNNEKIIPRNEEATNKLSKIFKDFDNTPIIDGMKLLNHSDEDIANQMSSNNMTQMLNEEEAIENIEQALKEDADPNQIMPYVIKLGNVKITNLLLLYGANPNYYEDSNHGKREDLATPLIDALIFRNPEIIKLLREFNADPKEKAGKNNIYSGNNAIDVAKKVKLTFDKN